MESPGSSILFFGEGAQDTKAPLDRILHSRRDDTLLASFLRKASGVLVEEVQKLPASNRVGFPNFRDLNNFSIFANGGLGHPALLPTEIVLGQLAHFIDCYEQRPWWHYPDAHDNILVGECFGELSALAVSLAKSLVELIPIATEAVRLAFRVGFLAVSTGRDIETLDDPPETWSIALSKDTGLHDDLQVKELCAELGIPSRRTAYVTANASKTITLGGPPSTLRLVTQHLKDTGKLPPKFSPHRVKVHGPAHASHLYSMANVRDLLDGTPTLQETFNTKPWPGYTGTSIGAFTGRRYKVANRRELFEQVILTVLGAPIEWDNVIEGVAEEVSKRESQKWFVRPFGIPSGSQNLASKLVSKVQAEVIYDPSFGLSDGRSTTGQKSPLAIVGMSGRFPGAASHDDLWKVLEQGLDAHKVIPTDRFDPETHLSQKTFGCFLDEPGAFDPRFFSLSPREATETDPAQRLGLVTAYEALEMSGYVPNRTPSTQLERVGTFYGQTGDEYREVNAPQEVGTYYIPGTVRAFQPGRINHFFKFGGPAYSIDTACSSSMVALNLACNSLWNGECDTALAGGVSVLGCADYFEGLHAGHFLSTTGGCKTYDDGADGYCRGEAVASVVIKRLDAAKADNDNIIGLVLSTGTNYSAESHSITHPHGPTQEKLYRTVLNESGIKPFDVDYVEMHGTGTQAGDAVEMSSVSNVFAPAKPSRPADNPLYVGAVKSNLGHGESASGITSLIKTLLIYREQRLPPHVGIKTKINHTFPDLAQRNLRIPLESTAFPSSNKRPHRSLVSNFSAAGGNTVLLIQEAPEREAVDASTMTSRKLKEHIVSVTAKSASALKKNIENLIRYLDENLETSIADLSYTTTARRMQHPFRTSIIATTTGQVKQKLSSAVESGLPKTQAKPSKVAFAFTGQGALYPSLARSFYEHSDHFRNELNKFDEICQTFGFPSFLPMINGETTDIGDASPTQTQLAMCAVQMGLCRLWANLGIKPDVVIGHSLGEYAALYASGVVSPSDALYLVGVRASILEQKCTMKTHSMLAIHATEPKTQETLGSSFDALEVACVNGPEDIVLSGPVEKIQDANEKLKAGGIKCSVLDVPFAFHSTQVEPILEPFERAVKRVRFAKPKIPVISPLLGEVVRDEGVISPQYLARHAREQVNFVGGLRQAEAEKVASAEYTWIELGPHPICLGMVKSTLGAKLQGVATLRSKESDWSVATKALSSLHNLGFNLRWTQFFRDCEKAHRLLNLPTYAFDNKNYFIYYKNNWRLDKLKPRGQAIASSPSAPLTTTVQRLVSSESKNGNPYLVFETDIADPKCHAVITGHLINGVGLCPASVYADIALTVADYIRREFKIEVPSSGINVMDMEIPKPITLPKERPEKARLVRVQAHANLKNGTLEIEYGEYSPESQKTDIGAKCFVEYGETQSWLDEWSRTSYLVQERMKALELGVQQGTTDKLHKGMIYKLFADLVHYEPEFQGMTEVFLDNRNLESVATLKLYDSKDAGSFFFSPFWVDSFAHLAGFVMNANETMDLTSLVYISHGWRSMRFGQTIDPSKPYRVHVKMQPFGKSMVAGDLSIFQGDVMMGQIKDCKFQQVPRTLLDSMLPSGAKPKAVARSQGKPAPAAPKSAPKPSPSKPKAAKTSRPDSLSKVLGVIAAETGVSPDELTDESDIAELGIDSLMSLTILSKLRETLQVDLTQSTFNDCATLGDLRGVLNIPTESSDSSGEDDSSSSPVSTPPSSVAEMPQPINESAGDSTVILMRETVAELIGVEVEELMATEDIAELGVDSLMSLSILGALREKLDIDIPSSLLQDNTSMPAIEKAMGLAPAKKPEPPKPQPAPASKAKPQSPQETTPKAKPSLIFQLQGNPKTASKYLFIFPDGSGSATAYDKMPQVSSDVCVFGLNSPYLKSANEYTCTIPEIAQKWVDEIRQRQPHGPYHLGGWSAGGYYCYEATRCLIAAGEKVETLVLIDSPSRTVFEPIPFPTLDFISTNNLMGSKVTPQWLVEHFTSTIKAVEKYDQPVPIEPAKAPKVFVIWARDGVYEDLEKEKIDLDTSAKVTRFMLQRKRDLGPLGWEDLLPADKIRTAAMPGTHFTLVQKPNCDSLSKLVADALQDDSSKWREQWSSA